MPLYAVGSDEEAALAHTTYDVKKACGAIARFHSTSTEMSTRQRARLDVFMRRYIERTRRSKEYTQQHRDHLADPRVVNGFRPLLKEPGERRRPPWPAPHCVAPSACDSPHSLPASARALSCA